MRLEIELKLLSRSTSLRHMRHLEIGSCVNVVQGETLTWLGNRAPCRRQLRVTMLLCRGLMNIRRQLGQLIPLRLIHGQLLHHRVIVSDEPFL